MTTKTKKIDVTPTETCSSCDLPLDSEEHRQLCAIVEKPVVKLPLPLRRPGVYPLYW